MVSIPASASAGSAGTEFVVTANKRPQLLDVPAEVTFENGDQLTKLDVTNVADLVRSVPSLNAMMGPAGPIAIRGAGTSL